MNAPHDVVMVLDRRAVLSRIWIDGDEWKGSVRRVSVDVDKGETVVTVSFAAHVTAVGTAEVVEEPVVRWPGNDAPVDPDR